MASYYLRITRGRPSVYISLPVLRTQPRLQALWRPKLSGPEIRDAPVVISRAARIIRQHCIAVCERIERMGS